ncbi:hypothetical protein NL676_030966 [Syzygium grande]|nr:hypothetical protein NL676_030966 [Syzygium grande]
MQDNINLNLMKIAILTKVTAGQKCYFVLTSKLVFPAIFAAVAMSKSNPCSTTPSSEDISFPAAGPSLVGVLK